MHIKHSEKENVGELVSMKISDTPFLKQPLVLPMPPFLWEKS